jgi:hypothetical protein
MKLSNSYQKDDSLFEKAQRYDRAKADQDKDEIRIAKGVLHEHLTEYRRFLTVGEDPGKPKRAWTPLQRTIRYASRYAESYLDRDEPEKVVEEIRRDMREEGRASNHAGDQALPRGVSEWIVQEIVEERD